MAQWSFDHDQAAGRGTDARCRPPRALYLPLASSGRTVGVLGLPLAGAADFRDPARRRLLESLAGQTAVAFERLALAERSRESEVEVEAERLRTALLSSLSHDMRTPLASIEGAASTLLQDTEPDPAARRELATTIVQESHRMGRLVANLLDMIRVEAGSLQVQKEWQLAARRDRRGAAAHRGAAAGRTRSRPISRRPAAGADGRDPAGAGLRQPARERRQAHAARHADRDRRRRAPGRGRGVRRGPRPGPGSRGGGDRLRQVLSRRHRRGTALASASRSAAASSPRTAGGSGPSGVRVAARSSAWRSRSPAPADPQLVTEEAGWTAPPPSSS